MELQERKTIVFFFFCMKEQFRKLRDPLMAMLRDIYACDQSRQNKTLNGYGINK